jgi:hypothetical protein
MDSKLYSTGNDMCQVEIYEENNILKINIFDPNFYRGGSWEGTVKEFLEDKYIGEVIKRDLGEATLQKVFEKAKQFLNEKK